MTDSEAGSNDKLRSYRSIGPFDEHSVPGGLLREHRLKPGSWARLEVLEGCLDLVWDDRPGQRVRVEPGGPALVPPGRPHHIEFETGFVLSIEFLAAPE